MYKWTSKVRQHTVHSIEEGGQGGDKLVPA
jgi:hypothetical protein